MMSTSIDEQSLSSLMDFIKDNSDSDATIVNLGWMTGDKDMLILSNGTSVHIATDVYVVQMDGLHIATFFAGQYHMLTSFLLNAINCS